MREGGGAARARRDVRVGALLTTVSWMAAPGGTMAAGTAAGAVRTRRMRKALVVALGTAAAVSAIEYKYGILTGTFSALYERLCTRMRVQATNRAILPYLSRDSEDGAGGSPVYDAQDAPGGAGAAASPSAGLHVDSSGKEILPSLDDNGEDSLIISESELSLGHTSDSSTTPNFFASTKFFACLVRRTPSLPQ